MPKYHFICPSCKDEKELYVSAKTEVALCSICATLMERQLPQSGSQTVTEIVDSFTGVRNEEDQRLKTKDRKTDHFWEVEVPRLVQTYSLQTCLEEKWLIYNDKGELVINKPPTKR